MKVLDVSSYQPRDLGPLILAHQPEMVIVRLYLPWERPPQEHSLTQIASARDNGCDVQGYCWLYRGDYMRDVVDSCRSLADQAGLDLTRALWADVETYLDGSMPSWYSVTNFLTGCREAAIRPGIYSSAEMWRRGKYGQLGPDVLLWAARYGVEPWDVDPFGGMSLVGHQYSSTPVDQSVFLDSF